MMEHRPGAGHPERPERLRAVLDALDDAGLSGDRRAATEASIADLERLHPVAYVANLLNAAPMDGLNALGISPRDLIAILQAIKASGALQAEIEVL